MKTIGRTNEGNYLIEITEDEHDIFARLKAAVEGHTSDYPFVMQNWRKGFNYIDLSDTFLAIIAFYSAKFRVNELSQLVENFNQVLEQK